MKLKKKILLITILLLTMIVALSPLVKVKAATGSLYLNIKMLRNSGYGYQLANTRKNVWKIYEVGGNVDDTIYCLKGGPGFGSSDLMTGSGSQSPTGYQYTRYFNLKQPSSIPANYQSVLPTINSNNYKALMWILDNCYVAPKQNASTEARNEAAENRRILLKAAEDYAIEVGNPDIMGGEFSYLTDDDIDATQQLAVWYYTNPTGDYHVNTFEFWINAIKGTDGSYNPLSDNSNRGEERMYACQALFDYLIETPQNMNYNYDYTSSNNTSSPVEFANTNITANASGSRIIVGPYRINETRNVKYSLDKTVKDGSGNVVSNVILLDENQRQVSNTTTLADLVGKDFYISLPSGTNITKVELSISGAFYTTTTNYWSVENPGSTDQPVVIVEKTKVPFTDKKEFTQQITGDYELELVKIDGQKESTKLQGAQYEVTLPNGTKQTYTTNSQGKINITGLEITQAGTQTITIKETKAPTGYSKNPDIITLTITTRAQNTNYIVDSVNLSGRTLTSNLQDTTVGKTNLRAKLDGNKIYIEMKNYKLDLALRKFITSIAGTPIPANETREPQISEAEITSLRNGTKTTANKVHPKNPLTVKTGDRVIYTIRIYNEGAIPAYAKEVTDYLPAGLKLAQNSTINTQNGWTASSDGKTIKTTKLAGTLLAAFDGNRIDYKDLQVECEVIATKNTQDLKNIAEITIHSDENGDTTVADRDSTPNNVDRPNYGNTSQQDDDDFEDLILYEKGFDLALRKFIISIAGKAPEVDRTPQIDSEELNKLKNEQTTTANKVHPKNALSVKTGDKVIYKIRIYNEGELDGYATEVTDYLPTGLKFLPDSQINQAYGWTVSADGRTVKTNYLQNKLLTAFDGTTLDYEDLEIECEVTAGVNEKDQSLKNIAEITEHEDINGGNKDRDSQPDNVDRPNYGETSQQDDDDFENLVLEGKYFDLSLRKFITTVQNGENTKTYERAPKVDTTYLANKTATTAIYNHPKDPIGVTTGSIVTYTLRVYNEGQMDGYVTEITDHLPPQLEFIVDDSLNAKYGWKIEPDGRTVKTTITSPNTAFSASRDEIYKDRRTEADKVLLKAFNGTELDYIDVQIRCKVKDGINLYQKITNIAQITEFTDENGNPVKDRDSQEENVILPSDEDLPNYEDPKIERGDKYIPGQQDDDDFEKLVLQRFDLALRKFITGVNDEKVEGRAPVFKKVSDTEYKYEHTKEPVEVANGNIVTYTLRIFNEGNVAGYAKEIKDNLPEGLEYLPEHELNKEYRWKMIDKEGKETKKLEEAVSIRTDYLSKEQEKTENANLIKAYDPETMTMPDYKDVKIAFKVTEPNTSDRIIINTAEITDDSDENGKPVDDIDSTPDNDKEGEDDIDIEKIKVKFFDLSLKKWVTESIVTYNGKTTVTKTGHTGDENPEPPAKVEIRGSRMSKTTVKFKFNIKVTNEGEIAGYAKEIIDYIPEGLKFEQKDNPKWRVEDGKVITDQLKDKLLQPGESATVEIILTWINNKDNLGEKVNWAEINKDDNEYDSPDIDSTPGNNEKGEDDIDRAPVILSVVTGSAPTYITLAIASISMIVAGVVLIKKFVI